MDLFVPEENWPETRMMIEKMLSGVSFSGVETRRYTKDGDVIPVSISGSTYRDGDGNPIGSVNTLRNISEQKKLEAQLQRAQKIFRSVRAISKCSRLILSTASDPVATASTANPFLSRIFFNTSLNLGSSSTTRILLFPSIVPRFVSRRTGSGPLETQ